MTEDKVLLVEIATNTRRMCQLLSLSLPKSFTSRLARTFDTDTKRAVYMLSDGSRSAREVARLAETSHPTVGRWWVDWESRGLMEDAGNGRMCGIFDLELLSLVDRLEEGM